MNVMIGIPTRWGNINTAMTRMLMQAVALNHKVDYPHRFLFRFCENITPCQFARNKLVGQFLKSDCEALWMIDDDMLPPKNAFDLLDIPGDIISGTSFVAKFNSNEALALDGIKRPAFGISLNAYRQTDEHGERMEPLDPTKEEIPGNTVRVDACGTAAIVIKRHVLEDEKSWAHPKEYYNPDMSHNDREHEKKRGVPLVFKDTFNNTGRRIRGHDIDFTNRAKRNGYSVVYVLDNEWGHVKQMDMKNVVDAVVQYVENATTNSTEEMASQPIDGLEMDMGGEAA